MPTTNVIPDEVLANIPKETIIRMLRVSEKNLEEMRKNRVENHSSLDKLVPLVTAKWILRPVLEPLPRDCGPLCGYHSDDYDEKTHSERNYYWFCGHCGYEYPYTSQPSFKYCPECGAKFTGFDTSVNIKTAVKDEQD